MLDHTRRMARYNGWANARLYAAASSIPDAHLREDCGLFFRSILHTLNHLLVADLVWFARIEGTDDAPTRLDALLHDDFEELGAARRNMDARIETFANALSDERLAQTFTYSPISDPTPVTNALGPVLMHLFNHQTHHRGQCHAGLTAQGHEAPAMDLIFYLREERDMAQSA